MRPHRSATVMSTALAASLLLVIGTVGGAVAAPSEVITIEIDLDGGGETFTSDSAVLCDSGVAITEFHFPAGNFNQAGTFHLNKTLVCDDGSGSFIIRVDAASNFVVGQGTTGGWSVVPGSGTGDYAGIRGGGHVVGINSDSQPIDLVDHYYGRLAL